MKKSLIYILLFFAAAGPAPLCRAEIAPQYDADLRRAASSEKAGRQAAFDSFFARYDGDSQLTPKERLEVLWKAHFVADEKARHEAVLARASQLKDAEARTLIGSYDEFPPEYESLKDAAFGAHARLFREGEAEAPARSAAAIKIFGKNPYDAPYMADAFADPYGFAARWQDEEGKITVDITPAPFKNFRGRLSLDGGKTRALWLAGFLEKNRTLWLANRGWRGTLENDALLLTDPQGNTRLLQRAPVGKCFPEKVPQGALVLIGPRTGWRNFVPNKSGLPKAVGAHGGVLRQYPEGGSLYTKEKFEDVHAYLEFRLPYNDGCFGGRRGNSGFYIGPYEIQINDAFGMDTADRHSGALYRTIAPLENAAAAPLEWQSLEVIMRKPRYDESGRKIANARLTAWMNGILIHDNAEVPDATPGFLSSEKKELRGPQALMLQGHGALVEFRNMWAERL